MADMSGNASSANANHPAPELPDIMVMMMHTLGVLEPNTRDQYPHIPDNAVIVLIRGLGVRRVDDNYDA